LSMVMTIRELGGILHSEGWPISDSGLMISTGSGESTRRTVLSKPEAAGVPVKEIPARARSLVASPDTTHPLVAYLLDEGGSERYRIYTWRPGSAPVPLTNTPERLELCCINSTGTLIAFSRNNKETGLSDVLLADPKDPNSVRPVISNLKGEASVTEWAPDGRRLLILQRLTFNSNRAFVFDVATNNSVQVAPEWPEPVNITGGTWSEDGTKLYLTSDAGSDFTRPFEIDLATNKIRPLTTDERHDAIDINRLNGTNKLVLFYDEDGKTRLYLLDPADNSRRPLPVLPGDFDSFRRHPKEPQFAEVVVQPDGRFAVFVIDIQTDSAKRWSMGEPPARSPVPSADILFYPTFDSVDGKPRQINVLLRPPPPEFSPPWPVMITLHGGPAAASRPDWSPIDAMFQHLGVAVLEPNVRGSTGFGKQFQTLDDQEKRQDAVKDVGALLDWIKTNPQLDASRVCVLGGSYGGYLSLATLVQYSNRLRCGVDLFGMSDLGKAVEASSQEHFVDIQRAEYGDERDPKTRAFLDSISPINHTASITVPVLIFQGANDVRVKPEQSRQMVDRLEKLGRDVRYIEADNEGHGLEMPLNQLYFGASVADFVKQYLLPLSGSPPATQ